MEAHRVGGMVPTFRSFVREFRVSALSFNVVRCISRLSSCGRVVGNPFVRCIHGLGRRKAVRRVKLDARGPSVKLLTTRGPRVRLLVFSVGPTFSVFNTVNSVVSCHTRSTFSSRRLSSLGPRETRLCSLYRGGKATVAMVGKFTNKGLLDDRASPFNITLAPIRYVRCTLRRGNISDVFINMGAISRLERSLGCYGTASTRGSCTRILEGTPGRSFRKRYACYKRYTPYASRVSVTSMVGFFSLTGGRSGIPSDVGRRCGGLGCATASYVTYNSYRREYPFRMPVISVVLSTRSLFRL